MSKIKNFLYKLYYRYFRKKEKQPKFFGSMILYRAKEIMSTGPFPSIVTGDSIIHFGESIIERNGAVKVTAIGGDTTDSLLSRLHLNIVMARPEQVLIHIGGNDFLAGKSVEYVANNIKVIARALLDAGVRRVGWMEILPLGNPMLQPISNRFEEIQFDKRPRLLQEMEKFKRKGFEVVPWANRLSLIPGQWRNPKYESGDFIHVNAAAYNDVIAPLIWSWMD